MHGHREESKGEPTTAPETASCHLVLQALPAAKSARLLFHVHAGGIMEYGLWIGTQGWFPGFTSPTTRLRPN